MITLAESEVMTAVEPEAATPPVKLRISALVVAVRSRLLPLFTVEPLINASVLLTMTLAPTSTDTAVLPEAAILNASERICD